MISPEAYSAYVAFQDAIKAGEDEAYQRGLADKEKELLGGEPDGYIGYHERHGFDKTSFRAKESLVAKFMDECFIETHPLDMG